MHQTDATMIGCPACAGVVAIEQGPPRHLRFVCSVGHAFSLRDVYEAKEQELERSQWSMMALLKHLEMILGLSLLGSQPSNVDEYQHIQHRLRQVREQMETVHRLIEDTDWLTKEESDAPRSPTCIGRDHE